MQGAWLKAWAVMLAVAFGTAMRAGAAAGGDDAWIARWLASATNLVTWQADVVQTRHLQALTQPLVSTGRVWFATPGSFRWELGRPPQSIALRQGDTLTVLSPKLRRAERHEVGPAVKGPAADMMALLDAGFPRDAAGFRKRFELTGVITNEARVRLELRPVSGEARRWMPAFVVELDPSGRDVRATEMSFADGSRLRNEFSSVVTNVPIDAGLFVTNLDAGWKVMVPGAGRGR